MKNIFFPMAALLYLIFFLSQASDAAIACNTVISKAAPCLSFVTGKTGKLAPACCTGLQQLVRNVNSVNDKKAICRCLKSKAGNMGIQDRFSSQIPKLCNVQLGFPVSTSTNCEAIH